jgi:hypothetical protein
MKLGRYIPLALFFIGSLLSASCEKAEQPIGKPQKGPAQITRVDMGEEYLDQIFFDFATGQSVMTSKINSWDLAFEAGPDGYHVFMNGAKDLVLYNTNNITPAAVNEMSGLMVEDHQWGFDSPSGLPDSTYIGDWRGKNETYILKFSDLTFKKVIFTSVNDTVYTIQYGDINSTLSSFTIRKNSDFNYAYFSFDNGGKQVYPEPAKNTWDIVFTRYRYVYYDLSNKRYVVTGVLLNPYQTSALADSTTGFAQIAFNLASMQNGFSNRRDVIGFDWKDYNFTTGMYQVDLQKSYVVRTRHNEYWKLRFLDFYNVNKVKGSPTFEFDRIH